MQFCIYKEKEMKTLVDINEDVLKEAMEVSETATKKETITLALEELIKSRLRQRLKGMAGSGMIGTGLSDLKSLRQRREKMHKVLRAVEKR
jgi:Arc/MetJ family transcription regulator